MKRHPGRIAVFAALGCAVVLAASGGGREQATPIRAEGSVGPIAATASDAPVPAPHTPPLAAGFRFSIYGPDYDPGPAYWRSVGDRMAERFPGAVPATIWIAGRLRGRGCELSFPGTSDDPLIQFASTDLHEETLDLFDRAGMKVWLQVEPGFASVEKLIHLMLERYGHHPSVIGVGVDVEWHRSLDPDQGEAVSDELARSWLAAARSHDRRYRFFLKHWLVEKMPPTLREGLLFVDDSQIFPSIEAMVDEFARWGRSFAPHPVAYQYGYPSDRKWWKSLPDPAREIGSRLVARVPNLEGLYWVDFTVLEVFPPGPGDRPRPEGLDAGFRYSAYGPEWDPGPAYWRDVAQQMAARLPGSRPGAVWIVGTLEGQGVRLNFPGKSDHPLIQFSPQDGNEDTLTLFDRAGVRTWLQVEPGNAPVETLIDLVLERYGHHPSIIGVGIDLEWYRSADAPDGKPATDEDAVAWRRAVRAHDPKYRIFLKHWRSDHLPPTERRGITFIDDSQIFPDLQAMVAEFVEWGRTFAPAPVGFQIGYETDRRWWQPLPDPPATIGRQLVERVPNLTGIYWVDFSVLNVFPPGPQHRPKPVDPDRGAPPIVGVKLYELPEDLAATFDEWGRLGIGHAFTTEVVAGDPGFHAMARERGVALHLIVPVFYDPEALEKDPDLVAVTADGKPARDDWVQFVCPSRQAYRERRVREIADAVRRVRPQGLSIDFIRHFVFWEKVGPATQHGDIPNACFCRYCVAGFAAKSGVHIPESLAGTAAVASWILANHPAEWTDWKVGLIDSMAAEVVRAAREVDPALRINLHAVPWRRFDFGGAILRSPGQDFSHLGKLVDTLSPMTYAHMLERPPDWVHDVVTALSRESGAPILPSIQVAEAYRPGVSLTVAEFEESLRQALLPPSRGVVFWSWAALAKDAEKRAVVQRVLAERKSATR